MGKLFTSESVTEGHPDKIADQISDAILDALLEQDPYSRVAAETTVATGIALVVGEITTKAYVDIAKIARDTIKEIGYVNNVDGYNANSIDAIGTWAPTLTKSVNTEGNKLLADGTGIFLAENTIFGRTEYINANPEIVQIFMRQYARAAQEVKSDIDGYAEKYKDYYGLDKDLLVSALEGANFPIVITDKDVEDLQITADFLYDNKFVKTHVTVKDAVDFKFVEDEEVKSYLTY